MIKVAVCGAAGRMGKSILNSLFNDAEMEVVGATESSDHSLVGSDLGLIANSTGKNILITDDLNSAFKDADVVIDFTTTSSTLLIAENCSRNKKSLVIGTTGFSSEEKKKLEKSIEKVPTVISPNMSIGVNLVFEVSKFLADRLGNEFDIEVMETHHRDKVDAPSGTALKLAESVAEGRCIDLNKYAKFERYGNTGRRKQEEIGIQTLRGGDVVGDHTVMFLGNGERIELTHRALSRENFSRGVLRAAKWIIGKPPGIYSMKDVLGI